MGATSAPRRAITIPRPGRMIKMSQTPIQSFLVNQTPEDRKKILMKIQKPRAPANKATEISSSAASPKLKRAAWKTIKIQRVPEVTRGLEMSAGKVTLLSKLFETATKADKMTHKQPGYHKNNTVSTGPALRPNTGITAMSSTPPYPEMSFQSGKTPEPIGTQIPGHVTPKLVRQPIRDEKQARPDHVGKDSHLSLGDIPQ